MVSITTISSFLILLLATYTYSAPIVQEYGNSTAEYESFTSRSINMELVTDDETTVEGTVQQERSSEESSEEATTEFVTDPSSTIEVSSFTSATELNDKRNVVEDLSETTEVSEKRNVVDDQSAASDDTDKRNVVEDVPETTEVSEKRTVVEDPSFSKPSPADNDVRSLDDVEDVFTTLESSTEFNRRAFPSVVESDEVETSTSVLSENQMEMTTNVEPSSSVDSFGKFTGLLHDSQSEEQTSTIENQSSEETTKKSKLVKTISVIPGKVTKTVVYANVPSKTSVVIQPVEQKQLSQGEKQ